MRRRSFSVKDLFRAIGAIALLAYAGSGLSLSSAAADGGGGTVDVRIRDNCEPSSFNAALNRIACVGDGNITFPQFVAALAGGGHHDWRFQPNSTDVKPGTTLRIENRGGETHSFTEVNNFGAIDVGDPVANALLNSSLPPTTQLAVAVDPTAPSGTFVPSGTAPIGTFVLSGHSLTIAGLGLGVHKFQCFIHPWMRSTITVKN